MSRGLLFLIFAVGTASAAAANEQRGVDDTLKAKALAMLGETKPLRPIARTLHDEEISRKGVFGKKLAHARTLYIPQEAGLVRIENLNSLGVWRQALLVCGLITLESSGFSPGGDVSTESQFRLTGLETSSTDLCRPLPGVKFSYRMQAELRLRIHHLLAGQPRTIAETYDVICKAAPSYTPGHTIFEGLKGDALSVQCERKSGKGNVAIFEYAFLKESGFYLHLSVREEAGSIQVRYTEVRYRE